MPTNSKKVRSNRRQMIFVVCVLLLTVVGYVVFAEHLSNRGTVQAHFVRADGTRTEAFTLEIAATGPERNKGLMFRKPGEMKRNEGMIFIFPKQKLQSFWMKNTYLSLDMLFVNKGMEVVGVLDNVPILNEKPRKVDRPSLIVVELLAGVARQHNIQSGAKLVVKGELPKGSNS